MAESVVTNRPLIEMLAVVSSTELETTVDSINVSDCVVIGKSFSLLSLVLLPFNVNKLVIGSKE